MSKSIKNVKRIQSKSRQHIVAHIAGNTYSVTSAGSGRQYTIRHSEQGCTCDCDWGTYRPGHDRRSACSHVIAVVNHIAETEAGRVVSVWGSETDAQRQHRPVVAIGDGVVLTSRLARA